MVMLLAKHPLYRRAGKVTRHETSCCKTERLSPSVKEVEERMNWENV
jgi:hypothetical protein